MKKSAKSRISSLIVGLLFLAACVVFILSLVAGGSFLPGLIAKSWVGLLLIAIGLLGMLNRGGRLFSLGVMLVGGGLLIKTQGWFGGILDNVAPWHMVVAALLFIIGIGSIGSALGIRKRPIVTRGFAVDDDGNIIELNKGVSIDSEDGEVAAVFSEQTASFEGQPFTGGEFSAIFGSLAVDMRGAVIEESCNIEANGIFGRLTIRHAEGVNYRLERNAVFGSVSILPLEPIEGAPTVNIEANGIFGSVEII